MLRIVFVSIIANKAQRECRDADARVVTMMRVA